MDLASSSSALQLLITQIFKWYLMRQPLPLKVNAHKVAMVLSCTKENMSHTHLTHLVSPVAIAHDSTELWNDVYGNFILQKLLEFGTDEMKKSLGKKLLSNTIYLSTKVYGW